MIWLLSVKYVVVNYFVVDYGGFILILFIKVYNDIWVLLGVFFVFNLVNVNILVVSVID